MFHARHCQKFQQGTKKFAPEFLLISALKLHSCELRVFINMSTYILTEDLKIKIKTSIKENHAIGLEI